MAAHIIVSVLQKCHTSLSELSILQTIAYCANVQGRNARLAYEAMSQRTGLTVRWCMELVARLEDRGLLQVTRSTITPGWNAINVYCITRPWMRDLSFREALERRRRLQHDLARGRARVPGRGSERYVHPGECDSKISPLISPQLTPQDLENLGLSPGSYAYRAALGLSEAPG